MVNQETDFLGKLFYGRKFKEKVIINAKLSLYIMKPNISS